MEFNFGFDNLKHWVDQFTQLHPEHDRENFNIRGDWKLTGIRNDGEIVYQEQGHNLVTVPGREGLFQTLFGFVGSGIIVGCARGSGAASANLSDSNLTYELIASGVRGSLTNWSNVALSASDVVAETITISGVTYYVRINTQTQWIGASDANVNLPHQEYALATNINCPGNPTGSSGWLLNHYVGLTPIYLTPDITLQVQTTLRI